MLVSQVCVCVREREREQMEEEAIRSSRCCLHLTMRIVNTIVNLCGVGIIIYSLWLQKMWNDGLSNLISTSSIPRPWFIYACLGVGIVVCLSTLVGHMVANSITNSTLCFILSYPRPELKYIISICCLVLVQVGVFVAIFFKMDLGSEIGRYIDEQHRKYKSFVIFHLRMCRLIVLMAIVAQISAVVFAIILWAIGIEPNRHNHNSDPPNFKQSFLVVPSSSLPESLIENFEELDQLNRYESFYVYIKGYFRIRLQQLRTFG